jgi:hypothetical protein
MTAGPFVHGLDETESDAIQTAQLLQNISLLKWIAWKQRNY